MGPRPLIPGWKGLLDYIKAKGCDRQVRSRVQIWRDIKAGRFPAPVQPGANSVAWYQDEVDAHLASLPRVSYAPPQTNPAPQLTPGTGPQPVPQAAAAPRRELQAPQPRGECFRSRRGGRSRIAESPKAASPAPEAEPQAEGA